MLEDINVLLKIRQTSHNFDTSNWDIKNSDISGKGVFANINFEPGDIVFKEIPLVSGPRSAVLPAACVVCMKMNTPLRACKKGCRLPVCGEECESNNSHLPECELLNRLSPKKEEHWSPFLYRALTPLRCLLLNERDRQIVKSLSAKKPEKHTEISLLKKEIENDLTSEDESFLDLCCRVLNGTAFEINMDSENLDLTLRGLFPLAGMMNHCCSPNTQHFYEINNNLYTMYVVATVPIKEGTEITTAYCPLLWSTMTRRQFLYLTKDFLCSCLRCQDPTEFGTYFSAHQCSCNGYVLPVSSLNIKSGWRCQDCGKTMSMNEVLLIETRSLQNDNLSAVPQINYLNIQKNIERIFKIGKTNRPYSEVTTDELNYKENAIKVVLDINDRLWLGGSRMKGILLKELHETLKEKKRRNLLVDEEALKRALEDARKILKNV